MDLQRQFAIMRDIARIANGVDQATMFDACMTILAINDVLNGYPEYSLEHGQIKLVDEVWSASNTAKTLMINTERIPTLDEMINAWYTNTVRQLNGFKGSLN